MNEYSIYTSNGKAIGDSTFFNIANGLLNNEHLTSYESAPACEKPDYSLYYMMMAFSETELTQLNEKIQNATDWEKIELEERISGLKFASKCLNEAWQRRKDVIA